MGTATSHKPDLVRYFHRLGRWAKWAWDLYRLFDLMRALAEVVF